MFSYFASSYRACRIQFQGRNMNNWHRKMPLSSGSSCPLSFVIKKKKKLSLVFFYCSPPTPKKKIFRQLNERLVFHLVAQELSLEQCCHLSVMFTVMDGNISFSQMREDYDGSFLQSSKCICPLN